MPTNGFYNDPVYNGGTPLATAGDYWPGYYSRTHVGVTRDGYRAVMDGIGAGQPRVTFTHGFGPVERPFYVRIRGTDGNRTAPGFLGAAVDPVGPAIDPVGNAGPWTDLWFYANPIWVLPRE